MNMHLRRGSESFQEPQDQEVCCEILCLSNIRNCINKVSSIWPNMSWTWLPPIVMPKWTCKRPQGLNLKKKHRHWRKAESRCGLTKGRAHLLAVECQIVSIENVQASSIVWTQQVKFRNIYIYVHTITCIHATTMSERNMYLCILCIHTITISEGIYHEFEVEQEGVCWKVQTLKRQVNNVAKLL